MIAAKLKALVDHLLTRVDYYALRSAKVLSQNFDGTLEVKLDDPKFPDMSKVPMRLGLPGTKVKVSAGARVIVAFENGDPSRPIATCWEYEAMTEIAFGGGSQGIARVGDVVALTLPPSTPFFAPTSSAGPLTFTNVAPIRVTGTILTGSKKVRA